MREPMSILSKLALIAALSAWLSAPCASAESSAEARPDAQKILAASDAVRNPAKPFGLSIVLVEYRDAKEVDRTLWRSTRSSKARPGATARS
jgi:hypothetical protein